MADHNYWTRRLHQSVSRRAMLRGAAVAGAGLAGAALIGCGEDEETEVQAVTPGEGAAAADDKRLDNTGDAVGSSVDDSAGDASGEYIFETQKTTPIAGGTWNGYYGGGDGHFSPHHGNWTETFPFLFDRLYTKFYRGDILAQLRLALSVERPDGQTTIVKMRPARFAPNSGKIDRAVTAEDVLANFILRRDDKTSYQRLWYSGVIDWSYTLAIDEQTLQIATNTPRADLFQSTNAAIVAREQVEDHMEGRKTLQELDFPAGSGPYYTTKYVPGSFHELTKNPGYARNGTDGWPYLDKVRTVKLNDEASKEAQFRAGNVDHYWQPNKLVFESVLKDLGGGDKPKVIGIKNFTAAPGPGLVLNTMVPLFRNEQRFRKAVTLAFDRQKWIDTIAQGEAVLVGPGFSRFYESFNLPEDHPAMQNFWRYDPAEGRKLVDALRSDGQYDLDREFIILTNSDSRLNQEYATLAKPMLEALGIKVRIEAVGTAEYWGRQLLQESADFDFAFPGYYATPEEVVGAYQTNPTTSYQTAALNDAKFDEMAERWFQATDPEVQAEIGKEIMLYLTDYYPLHQAMYQSFWRKLLNVTVRNNFIPLFDAWQPWQWKDPSYA